MTTKRKIFENVFQHVSRVHGFMHRGQIWWKSTIGKLRK